MSNFMDERRMSSFLLVVMTICFIVSLVINILVSQNYEYLLENNTKITAECETWKGIAINSQHKVITPSERPSFNEWLLLAKLIDAEAGNQSYSTKLMVGSVVMNRVADKDFPNNIYDVVFQTGQFEVVNKEIAGKLMIDRDPSEESMKAAEEVLSLGSVLPCRVLLFYTKGCSDGWIETMPIYEESGDMVFSFLK